MAWERLAHVALSGAGDSLASGTFTAKKSIKVIVHIIASGDVEPRFRFNGDSGANYSYRKSSNGGSDGTSTSITYADTYGGNAGNTYIVSEITNISAKEKLMITHTMGTTAGAGNAPDRREYVQKWANTSAQITSIEVSNGGSGDFAIGSYITVLGAKEAATSDTITVSDLTAKKHLMIQAKIVATGAVNTLWRFNNDSGSNYSNRHSENGGSEDVEVSIAHLDIYNATDDDDVGFFTMNVINEASKEKLVIAEVVGNNANGAGNAPTRDEHVAKWANTSNAITRVDVVNTQGGSYAEGSEVTVYGTD